MKWNKEKIIKELLVLEKKLKRRPTKHDHSNLYFLSRKYFGSWNNLMKAAGYEVKYYQKPKISNSNPGLLYYFLGLLITDGHIVFDEIKKKYRILLFTSQKNERNMIIKLIKNLFDYNASVRSKKYGFNKKINYEIYISSKKLCNFLRKKLGIPSGAKSLTIDIPESIKTAKKENIWHFIRGVFDGDGSIIKTEKANALKIPSGSRKFIITFNNLFISLGFNSGIIRQERANLWLFKINKKGDIKKIYSLIYKNCRGYYYPRKKETWKQYI
jgi:intein/homing endonuclease